MTRARSRTRALVVAKAPVPGREKTRLGADIGAEAASRIAAAALLDTLAACTEAFGADHCLLALSGDLGDAVHTTELREALEGWEIYPQRGEGFAARLAHAHRDAGRGRLVQVGMDTPQVTADLLGQVAAELDGHEAVLGPAEDGGWWVLGLRDPRHAGVLAEVEMSTGDTGRRTRLALEATVTSGVALAPTLRDVDTVSDAHAVARSAPTTRFARAWAEVSTPAGSPS